MIELDRDSIWLTQPDGQAVPCSLDQLTFEIAGNAASKLDPEVLRHAAAGVLHYFKDELGRSQITLGKPWRSNVSIGGEAMGDRGPTGWIRLQWDTAPPVLMGASIVRTDLPGAIVRAVVADQ